MRAETIGLGPRLVHKRNHRTSSWRVSLATLRLAKFVICAYHYVRLIAKPLRKGHLNYFLFSPGILFPRMHICQIAYSLSQEH